ncbi:MAG: type II secretion system F family protein [Candidatus Omnitrophica bacterium]|nr:type II secretion system F family protein [Candidatus Omnitrophota bacterium]
MPNFKYKARDKFSTLVSGMMAADNKEEAAGKLRDIGYTPISIVEAAGLDADSILRRFRKVKLQEISTFTRQLYSLQKAGIPLLSSLEAIALQTKNQYFKIIIERIAADIKGGLSFSEALGKQGSIFDEVYFSMVKSAEASGRLVEILERLSGLIEEDIDTKARIQAATRYPLIAFVTLCLGFLIVVTFVIPRFASLYGQYNAILPLPTRILLAINTVIHKFWLVSIIAAVSAVLLFLRFINSKAGRPVWDKFKLNIFILGPLLSMLIIARFARITAILLKSGVPILEILNLAKSTAGNIIIARAIENIRESVKQGKGLSEPMKVSGLFAPIVVQMVAIGEQSGKVDELLLNVADYYDRETSYMIKNLTTYIEPLLIFALAVMVLIMALAIFMPMWNLIKVFRPS